jgi:hypothetical protein
MTRANLDDLLVFRCDCRGIQCYPGSGAAWRFVDAKPALGGLHLAGQCAAVSGRNARRAETLSLGQFTPLAGDTRA